MNGRQIMDYLHKHVFDPILTSPRASAHLKQRVRYTIRQMEQRDAAGMILYYWRCIIGTESSMSMAAQMRREGFKRFEETIEEFRAKFPLTASQLQNLRN